MQDIFEDTYDRPKKEIKKAIYTPRPADIFDYLIQRHIEKYGEKVKVFYSRENKDIIRKYANSNNLPLTHYLAFVFKEMANLPIWANILVGKDWPIKFNLYLESTRFLRRVSVVE